MKTSVVVEIPLHHQNQKLINEKERKKMRKRKRERQRLIRVKRGGEERERGRGGRLGWRMGRHIENVSGTITNLVYTTVIFIYNLDL